MKHLIPILFVCLCVSSSHAQLQVGATVVDITPPNFPVYVNGGMTARQISEINTPVSARAMVLDDGTRRIAMVVVDSCMVPKFLCDDIKTLAATRTKLRADQIMISATHTHTAPSVMGALGTPPDERYIPYMREKVAESIATAEANLQPAHVGWGEINADKFTALRRWIRRTDMIDKDPFGNATVRANMHAARNPETVTGQSGPEDPILQVLAFASPEGKPIAAMANFSMHYFGDKQISADYFGLFCNEFQKRVTETKGGKNEKPFVASLSHGCSGDIWRRDYTKGPDGDYNPTISEYSTSLLDLAMKAYNKIEYKPIQTVRLLETRLPMMYRLPNAQMLEWSKGAVKEMGDRLPKTREEVYAQEQLILNEIQSTEVVVQGIQIGDIGIATTPNETYALTGLKIKLQSPFKHQMVIELANGGDGYIPPPEQHYFGGYNTWPARSAGLEVTAEPRITEAALQLLESASDKPRTRLDPSVGELTKRVLAAKPYAFLRLDEAEGKIAFDSSGNGRDCTREPGYALFLRGVDQPGICENDDINRASHVAGSRITCRLPPAKSDYSVGLWFWNGMPDGARDVSGWLLSRDRLHQTSTSGDSLGIAGKTEDGGRLLFAHGKNQPMVGVTPIRRWTWNHVLLVREGKRVRVYLNGSTTPELQVETGQGVADIRSLFVGGRSDHSASPFEGRLDEVMIFDRALSATEIHDLAFTPR